MNARASRLLALYGLFVLIAGAFGFFVYDDEASRAVFFTVGLGAVLFVVGSAVRNGGANTVGAALMTLLLTIAISAVNAVRGWVELAGGSSELFLWNCMLTVAALFGTTLIRLTQKAWKRAQQFEKIIDSDSSDT